MATTFQFNPLTGQFDLVGSGSSGITIGTTTITSGTTTRILYDNAGVVGEYTLTGTGTVVAMQTAPTLTGPVIVNEAVGSSGLTLTGATQTASFPALSMTQTWNNAGVTFTGLVLTVTNTASAAASKLMELFLGAATMFAVRKDGRVDIPTNGGIGYSILVSGQNAVGFSRNSTIGGLSFHGGGAVTPGDGNPVANVSGSNGSSPTFKMDTGTAFGWCSGAVTQTHDVILRRDAADTLALRNATTAQKMRIYNTFTTVETAGEWFAVDWATTANVCNLQAVKGSSSGTARVLTISYGGTQASPVAAISVPITSGQVTLGGGLITGGTVNIDANFQEWLEQTAPAAGAANTCRVYAQDNGAGKTQLMALFNSGAAQQIAIQP